MLAPAMLVVACGAEYERAPTAGDLDLDIDSVSQFNPANPDERDEFASGGCDLGAAQECRVYLPEHNGVQPCFVGNQYCIQGSWSHCLDPALVDANDQDALIALEEAYAEADINSGS